MCNDRRKTFEVADMTGQEPRQIVSFNLSRTQFMLTLVATIMAVLGSIWATTSMSYTWMEDTAEHNYHDRVAKDLEPTGDIYREVDKMIQSHEIQIESRIEEQFREFDIRLSKVETITALTYEAVTGKKVPSID